MVVHQTLELDGCGAVAAILPWSNIFVDHIVSPWRYLDVLGSLAFSRCCCFSQSCLSSRHWALLLMYGHADVGADDAQFELESVLGAAEVARVRSKESELSVICPPTPSCADQFAFSAGRALARSALHLA